jgi:hypothetical protein
MQKEGNKRNSQVIPSEKEVNETLKGYPLYPDKEDIYNNYKKDESLDPEDTSKIKELNSTAKPGTSNEKDFNEDESGSDLDVPGSELDDLQEIIGNEDEENNYYSLGGDDHNDLDEDRGE